MTVPQLSVFIENKSGTLVRVLDILKEKGIQLIASTIADTQEYGIFRTICSDPHKAFDALKSEGIAVALSDVFAVTLDDVPGCAADAISIFAREGISIAYLYSFLLSGKGVLIFRTDNAQKAAEAITRNGLSCICEDELKGL